MAAQEPSFTSEFSLTFPLMLVNIAQPLSNLILTRLLSLADDPNAVSAFDIIQNAEALTTAIFLIFIKFMELPFGRIYGKKEENPGYDSNLKAKTAFSTYSTIGNLIGIIPSLFMVGLLHSILKSLGIKPDYIKVASQYFLIRGLTYCFESSYLAKRQMSFVIKEQWMAALFTGIGSTLIYGLGRLLFLSDDIQKHPGTGAALAIGIQAIAQYAMYILFIKIKRPDLHSKCCEHDKASFKKYGKELSKLALPFILVNFGYVASGFFRSVTFNHMSKAAVDTDLVSTKFTQIFQGLSSGITTACGIQASKLIGQRHFSSIKKSIGYNLLFILGLNALWFLIMGPTPSKDLIQIVSSKIELDSKEFKIYFMLMSISQLVDTLAFPLGGLLLGLYDIWFFVGVTTLSPLVSGGLGYALTKKTDLGINGFAVGFIVGNALALLAITLRLTTKHKELVTNPDGYGARIFPAARMSDAEEMEPAPEEDPARRTSAGSDTALLRRATIGNK